MKIWKKIFIYSFLLFIFVFNISGIIIIENIYSRNLNSAIKKSINESKEVNNTIYLNSDLFSAHEDDILWKKLKSYVYSGYNNFRNIEIYNMQNKIVMKTSSVDVNKTELLNEILSKEYKFTIKKENGIRYILVGSEIKVGKYTYKVIVTDDINDLWIGKMYNYKIFIMLSLVTTIILAIGLYLISKKITIPIEKLTKISNSIESGDYSKRADYVSNDEIGILSKNFNSMMSVIEENITELKEVSEQKQRFIDNLTHEMKTPITSILGYSDLLLKGNLNEEIKMKSLMNINLQGKRLENLNDSLIKLILIKNTKIEKTKININDMVKEIYLNNTYKSEIKNIKFIKDIKNGFIISNKELINVLFNNLIDNALKASKENSVIEIIGKPIKDNCFYELKVKDHGCGIPKEDLNKIREPFYMGDKARATKGKNMGLGLSICNDICTLNDIELNIESKVNIGTTITLKFKMENKDYES